MFETVNCPRSGCNYSGTEHGLKSHFVQSHEDTKYGREQLSCHNCGDDFTRRTSEIKSERVFCSRECKDSYRSPNTFEERKCNVCEETKTVRKSSYNHKNGWVCSKECNKKQYRHTVECVVCGSTKVELESNERKFPYRCSEECVAEWRKVETSCSYCDSIYIEDRHQVKRYENTYCSDKCFYNSQRKEKAINAELQRWANLVKELYNHTCADCGNSYEVMSAHHSPPRSELSKEEQTNIDNGVCLCYPCHADRHDEPQSTALLSWWGWYKEYNQSY